METLHFIWNCVELKRLATREGGSRVSEPCCVHGVLCDGGSRTATATEHNQLSYPPPLPPALIATGSPPSLIIWVPAQWT